MAKMAKNLINFHLHSTGSDGKMAPEDVINEAVIAGINYICFTDHYKLPNNLDIYSQKFYSDEHFEKLLNLSKQEKEKIDISLGAEFEWYPGYNEWYGQEISRRNYDFLIGAVHGLLYNKEITIGFWDKPEYFDKLVRKLGGKENYVREYFNQVRLMAKSKLFDCIGHLDILKYNNTEDKYFSENDNLYVQEIKNTLDTIAESKTCIEINMRGAMKQGEGKQCPSLWILKEARKRNIPVTIGTDAHTEGQVGKYLQEAYELARQAGYKEIVRFKARKMISMPID